MVHTIRISAYDEFDGTVNKIVQERKGQNIFVLLFGKKIYIYAYVCVYIFKLKLYHVTCFCCKNMPLLA